MGSPRHQEGWSEPRVALLRKLWIAGHSATQIARALGGEVTRNGVISKVHRLGISPRTAASTPPGRQPAKPPKPVQAQPSPPRVIAAPRVTAPAPPPEPALADMAMVTLIELGAYACKWPVGSPAPQQRFCGRRQVDGRPYCAGHVRMAFSSASGLAKHSTKELVRSVRRYI